MAECDQDIQRGSSTELTQLVLERNVNLNISWFIHDITALPDGNIVVITLDSHGSGLVVGVFDATNMNVISGDSIKYSTHLINLEFKSASVVSIGSNGIMVVTVRTGTYTTESAKRVTTLHKSRHAVMNGHISMIASTNSMLKYKYDVVCTKSKQAFIMLLTTAPPQLEIENLETGLSENVQLTNFSTQSLSTITKPYMCVDDSEGQTHVFISAMVGVGNRVVTKLNLKGEILATLVDPLPSIPGPIAAVGDGTLLFKYGDNICLLSGKCKIVATLGYVASKLCAMCFKQTTSGHKLYCAIEHTGCLIEYSLK